MKYDWNKLKLEFFKSDYDDVASFIEKTVGKKTANNSTLARNTKWWTKEKKDYKDSILEKALLLNANKQAKELEIPMEQLWLAKRNAVIKVIQQMMNKDMDINELERTIKIIRTEMWLPTTYSKNENLNTDKIEWIHIVWWGNFEKQ
jgi:hypothetical protein